MSFQPDPLQVLFLWRLLASDGEAWWKEVKPQPPKAKRDELERCRAHFGQGALEIPDTLDWQRFLEELFEAKGEPSPACCPVCGKRLVRTRAIAPARHKPVLQRSGVPPPSQPLSLVA